MKVKVCVLALLLCLLTAGSSPASAAPSNPFQVPVTLSSAQGTFTGVFEVVRFAVKNGNLTAIGTLTGTVTNALGQIVGTVNINNVNLPVQQITGSCQILHLELGPLDLDLLGLRVHLNRIILDVTAQSGPGNLLGNLLCSLANLLNRGLTPLQQIADILNQILSIFG
jgi:hypothetical protein